MKISFLRNEPRQDVVQSLVSMLVDAVRTLDYQHYLFFE